VIRAFIAVEISPSVLKRITAAADVLRSAIPDIRWIPPANWHLTLKFLGAIDADQVLSIHNGLERQLSLFPPCTINAKGLGIFPDVKKPRILWVGMDGNALVSLAEKVETALAPLGFVREQRAFKPHLTIGRWREGRRSGPALKEVLEQWRNHDFGSSAVSEVKLFQSILKPGGAQYLPLKTTRLNPESAPS
jgi:2'-5' RNA ligase